MEAHDGKFWKHHLMVLQESAPKPVVVPCTCQPSSRPLQYGVEFHGVIERSHADHLLSGVGQGAYLVRESQRAANNYTLCLRFHNQTKNYRLYFDGQHYVGDKRFETLDELVADGLICMYMDIHAKAYIDTLGDNVDYDETPYAKYQRDMRRAEQSSPHSTQISLRDRLNDEVPSKAAVYHKAHMFKPSTFNYGFCDFCGNFLFGLTKQGVKCTDCGYAAHKRCSDKTRPDCQPHLKYVKRVFAVDLCTLCMARGTNVPPIVLQCVAEIESRGLFAEGIYRVSGSHDDIERLRTAFDICSSQSRVDLSPSRVEDVHTIAGLLKLYFRLLPNTLITYNVYGTLVRLLKQHGRSRLDRQHRDDVQSALAHLPEYNRETLRVLVKHLALVAEHHAVNKMTIDNLAMVFAPTIICHSQMDTLSASVMPQHEASVLHFLVRHEAVLFVAITK